MDINAGWKRIVAVGVMFFLILTGIGGCIVLVSLAEKITYGAP